MFPATTQASKDTSKEERGRVPKGRRKEREGKEKEEDRCSQLRTSVQGHTNERGVNLSIAFRGGEGRREGAKVATDSNES